MARLLKYLLVLVTPWGRLPQFNYAVLALLTIALHVAITVYLSGHADGLPAYNPFAIAELALLWVMFSLLSRRFHDTGDPAIFLFPLLICTIVAYLAALDHGGLAVSVFEEDRDSAQMYEHLKIMFQASGLALALFAMKNPGDPHANTFGPEFTGAISAYRSRFVVAMKPADPAWKKTAPTAAPTKPARPRKPGFGTDMRTSNPKDFRRRSTDR